MRDYNILVFLLAINVLAAGLALTQKPRTSPEEPTFRISTPLEFKGRLVSGSLRKSDIAALLDLPVRNGDSDLTEGFRVEMTRPSGEKFKVYTCREWKKAQREKAYSATTYDMAMESSLIHTCDLLFRLQKATVPLKSFIANPRVTLADVDLLPAEILSIDNSDEDAGAAHLDGLTISRVVPPKDIEEANETVLRLSFGGYRQFFQEAARADFDGDGFEEIFIFMGGRAEGGTLGYADNIVLTRTGSSGPLKFVQEKNRDR